MQRFLRLLSLHYYFLHQSLVIRPTIFGFHTGQPHVTWPIILILLSYNSSFLLGERSVRTTFRPDPFLRVHRQSHELVRITFLMARAIKVHTLLLMHSTLREELVGINHFIISIKNI